MPISKEEFETSQERDLSKQAEETLTFLEATGKRLGFKVDRNYPHWVGDLDLVWYLEMSLPGLELGRLPVVGFEIETSWRTRKHVKGDVYNLQQLHPSLSIVILLKKGFKDEGKFRGLLEATKRYAEHAGCRTLVWTEEELERLKAVTGARKSE
ncbi:MAG: hypothetical protein V1857_04985 [archaeon]